MDSIYYQIHTIIDSNFFNTDHKLICILVDSTLLNIEKRTLQQQTNNIDKFNYNVMTKNLWYLYKIGLDQKFNNAPNLIRDIQSCDKKEKLNYLWNKITNIIKQGRKDVIPRFKRDNYKQYDIPWHYDNLKMISRNFYIF